MSDISTTVVSILSGLSLVLWSLGLFPARFLKYNREFKYRLLCFIGGLGYSILNIIILIDLLYTAE